MKIQKEEFRTNILNLRNNFPAEQKAQAENDIFDKFKLFIADKLQNFRNLNNVFCYISMKNEYSTTKILKFLITHKINIYIPVVVNIKSRKMIFVKINKDTRYEKSKLHILEPIFTKKDIFKGNIVDLTITPLLGFDDKCYRLGFGGGFYDTFFANKNINFRYKLGLSFEFQKIKKCPINKYDINLDTIITEKNIYIKQ